MTRTPTVSVVLPAYNEAATIEDTVHTTLSNLGAFLPPGAFEVIVAEDGCDDETPEIAAELSCRDPRVRHVHSDERLGRGGALERAFRSASGETLVYFDTDLATDMRHLERLVESVRTEGYDIATGSRWMPGETADRPVRRDLASRGFNALARLALGSAVRDHQCGFKAFDRRVLFSLLDDVGDDHWFWDTEMLVRAQRAGYRIREFPVEWTPKGDSKVDLVRDVFGMGSQILRCWWEFSVDPRITPRRTLGAGTALVVLAALLLTQYIDPTAVVSRLARADRTTLLAATVVYLLSWPVRGIRYRDILAELGYREGVGVLTGAIFISQTGNLVFPARAGDAVRAYVLRARRGIPYPTGLASLAVERVFDLGTIAVLAGSVLVGLAVGGLDLTQLQATVQGRDSGRVGVLVAGTVAASVALLVAVIVVTARSDRRLVRSAVEWASDDSYVERLVEPIERFVGDVQTVTTNRRTALVVGGGSLVVWSLDVVTALLVLVALGVAAPTWTLVAVAFFAVSVGNLAKVLPLSPGGIGLYEGAFATLLVALVPAVGWELALGAALVDHAIKNLVTLVGGLASTAVLNVSLTSAVRASGRAEPLHVEVERSE